MPKRIAFCVALKNRSAIVVEPEDSLQYVKHVQEKLESSKNERIVPYVTKDNKILLFLMPKMIRSLISQKKPEDDWVIIVVDYNSTDVNVKDMLDQEIGERMPWHLETITSYPHFDRGGGLKRAAELAESKFSAEAVFFCDADLEFKSRTLFDEAQKSLKNRHFFYPIFFSFVLADHSIGFWRDTSFGNFACCLEDYKKTEGWYHNISWGWEDRALADSIPEEQKDRKRIEGFYHQWHPLQWEFRVKEYPVKEYLFKDAAVKRLNI